MIEKERVWGSYYKNEAFLLFRSEVARWPRGCRRQCSEVAVPALVGSNLTERGRIFSKEGTSAGPWMCVYVFQGLTVGWWKEERHSSDTIVRSAGFKSWPDGPPIDVVLYSCCVVQKGERRREGGRLKKILKKKQINTEAVYST
jgi:hypothetical protein